MKICLGPPQAVMSARSADCGMKHTNSVDGAIGGPDIVIDSMIGQAGVGG